MASEPLSRLSERVSRRGFLGVAGALGALGAGSVAAWTRLRNDAPDPLSSHSSVAAPESPATDGTTTADMSGAVESAEPDGLGDQDLERAAGTSTLPGSAEETEDTTATSGESVGSPGQAELVEPADSVQTIDRAEQVGSAESAGSAEDLETAQPAQGAGPVEEIEPVIPAGAATGGVIAVGRAFLASRPDESDMTALMHSLRAHDSDPVERDPVAAASRLVGADFRSGRMVELDGWVLSVSEARAAAVVALSCAESC